MTREEATINALRGHIEALEQESCEPVGNSDKLDCISREFIEIVVNYPPADLCTYPKYKGKPYYSIKYRENGKEYVGFGTYKIEMLSQWIKQYFISVTPKEPKTDICCKWSDEEISKSFIEDVEAVKEFLPCGERMEFPNTFDEFAKDYSFVDKKEIYTNGSDLIPVFRVKQWLEHIEQEPYFWEKCPYYEPDIMFDEKDEYDMGKCAYKQEPKTVIYSGDGYADGYMAYDMAECPNCGYEYEDGDKDWGENFCPHCGQPLKWESEE